MNTKEFKHTLENYKSIYFKKHIYDIVDDEKNIKQYLNNKILELQFEVDHNPLLKVKVIKKKDDLNTIYQRKRDFYIKTLTAYEIAELLNNGCNLGNVNDKEITIDENTYKEVSNYVNKNISKIVLLFEKREKSITNFKDKKKFSNYKIMNSILKYVGLKIYNTRPMINGERIRKPHLKYTYIL